MGVESVRQASVGRGLDTSQSPESEEIRIDLQEDPEYPLEFDELPDYPFPDQTIVRGEYYYESSPRFGDPETGEGSFQMRTGSGMAILHTQNDRPRPKKIFSSLNQAINGDAEIKKNFVPNQNRVWQFIERGNLRDLKVITPSGRIKSAMEIDVEWDDMKGKYPVELAVLEFTLDGEAIRVRYHDDSLEIQSCDGREREYVIQIFESVMAER
ncbi:hypothetical protein [Halococcoides cellulosivorans]|uniref:Uncharacterized protein n=1 Tax=Halococcoides cellulosivorans TaxID=1679096 RepID=A0A2R4X3G4_9EURY|nr:hypothetical protein [Halococcoides cellulosivorans]AWB28340.1 hypothetical protein HARCEL1_11795 [Halococcoides cellulosivorans]